MLTLFNTVEAALWLGIGLALALVPRIRGLSSANRAALVVSYLLFGVSDLIELRTGAFWRPWWLLLFKAVCLAGIVTGMTIWLRRRRSTPS